METKIKFTSVEEYIDTYPSDVKEMLEELRNIIKQITPEAEELISYNMPAFKLHSILVYYAAYKNHIGFYPANAFLIEFFKDDLTDYETSKGTIRFPLDRPLPIALIKKIVAYRIEENREKAALKVKKKK